jgi:hypothetical protein
MTISRSWRWVVRTARGDSELEDLLNELENEYHTVHTIVESRDHLGPTWTVMAYLD